MGSNFKQLDNKTKDLITYIISKHHVSTITSLIKLCYLSDLVSFKDNGKQISSFQYVRWYYGPYDKAITEYLYALVDSGVIEAVIDYTQDNQEYIKYFIEQAPETSLSDTELGFVNSVLESLKGFGPKALTEVAYRTKPMKKLGATLGGNEHLGKTLDLSAT